MNLLLSSKRYAMLILGSLMVLLLSCSSGAKSESFVSFCTGSSTIKKGSMAAVPIQIKDKVEDGDIIKTGDKSYVIIQSTDGLVLRLEQNTELAMASFNKAAKKEIHLTNGKVLSSVSKLKKGSEYMVKTPTAIASVRGTEFLTAFNGKKSIVAVGQGSVNVKKTAGPVDEKLVEKGNTAVVAEQAEPVSTRNISRLETLELSKFQKTPVVENIETKKPEEIKELFKETVKVDEKINFDIKGEVEGFTKTEMKDEFKRVDVISLFNGRVIEGIIVTRGEFYRIITTKGPIEINSKEIKRTDTK